MENFLKLFKSEKALKICQKKLGLQSRDQFNAFKSKSSEGFFFEKIIILQQKMYLFALQKYL